MESKIKKQHIEYKKRHGIVFNLIESLFHRLIAVGFIYGLCHLQLNPIWIIIPWGILKYRDQKRLERTFRQEAAQAISMKDERSLVLANVDPLPPWVYFTDTERCEWVNKVIGHIWPSLQPIVVKQLKNLEPIFNEKLSQYKKNPRFLFNTINLGCLTPRVSGVRVNDTGVSGGDRSLVDVHVYYVSDCKFYCSLLDTIGFGIDNFQIKGCLRAIVTTPQGSYFPGVEIFFVRQPEIDFNLTGLLNIADMPGISGILRSTVDNVIQGIAVLPHKIVINYDDRIDFTKLRFPDPLGLLTVNAIEAKDLGGSELHIFTRTRNPDPSITIRFGTKIFTSPPSKNSKDPKWSFTVNFVINSFFDDTVTISIDDISRGKNLGKLSFGTKLIERKLTFDSWIQLEDVTTGMVHLCVTYHKVDHNPELLDASDVSALLEIRIEEAKNLVNNKSKVVAEISVGKDTQLTRPVPVNNAVFGEIFSFLVKNPKSDKFQVKLIDEDSNKVVGTTDFEVKDIIEANNMEISDRYKIKGANENSRLSVSMRLRTLN